MNDKAQPTRQVMLDIETLDTKSTAAIISIGMTLFSVEEGIVDTYYREIDLQSCLDLGLTISTDTLHWWLRGINLLPTLIDVTDSTYKRTGTIQLVLTNLINRLESWIPDIDNRLIWCKGTDFDISILCNAYNLIGYPVPWKYNKVRDLRTLIKLFPQVPAPPKPDNLHNALTDARWQTQHLISILEYIKEITPNKETTLKVPCVDA